MSPEFGSEALKLDPPEGKSKTTRMWFDADNSEIVIETIDPDGNLKTVHIKIDSSE